MNVPGATTEVATLKKALSEAENKAAKERTEREKQEARVGEVQQELQALVSKHEALEHDSKMRESELTAALESAKNAKAEVAVGKGVTKPHPDYKALHGLFGRLVQLDQLFQLVAHRHRMFGPNILRPEQLLRRASLLVLVIFRGIRHDAGQICECSWRAPDSGK